MKEYCYVTRDTGRICAEVWPAGIGIRKVNSRIEYGAAWGKTRATCRLYKSSIVKLSELLTKAQCRKRFGFYPRAGQAWDIDGKKRTRIDQDMLFSP